ncbi:hypothetical protein AB0A99_11680, partial [Streptomyces fradiae]
AGLSSTIGHEKRTNTALTAGEEAYVEQLLAGAVGPSGARTRALPGRRARRPSTASPGQPPPRPAPETARQPARPPAS